MSDQAQPAREPADDSVPADGSESLSITVAEFEALKKDAAEWRERCLRNQAEFDNVRKRLRKEADEAATRGVVRAVKPFLNEIDNLGRAVDAATPETFGDFAQGVSLIRENLKGALVGLGVEAIPCEGVFDPALHEVLAEQEQADAAKGQILQVHRAGYKLKDQLVRTAQVVVARPPA